MTPTQPAASLPSEEIRILLRLFYDGTISPGEEATLFDSARRNPGSWPEDIASDLLFILTLDQAVWTELESLAPSGLEEKLKLRLTRLSFRSSLKSIGRFAAAAAVAAVFAIAATVIFRSPAASSPELADTAVAAVSVHPDTSAPALSAVAPLPSSHSHRGHLAAVTATAKQSVPRTPSKTEDTVAPETVQDGEEEPAVEARRPNIIEIGRITDLVAATTLPSISTLSNALYHMEESLNSVAEAFSETTRALALADMPDLNRNVGWREP